MSLDSFLDLGDKTVCQNCGVKHGTLPYDSNMNGEQFPAEVKFSRVFQKYLCQKCFYAAVPSLAGTFPEASESEQGELDSKSLISVFEASDLLSQTQE